MHVGLCPSLPSSYSCLCFRHANSLFKKGGKNDEDEDKDAIFGTFTCQAFNIAGTGQKCELKVNGPVAALVVDTDTTYLVFGGLFVLALLAFFLITVVVCRKLSLAKYDAGNIVRTPEEAASNSTNKSLTTPAGGNARANGNATVAGNGNVVSNACSLPPHGGNLNTMMCNTTNGSRNGNYGGGNRTDTSLSDEMMGAGQADIYGVTHPLMKEHSQQPPPPPMYQRPMAPPLPPLPPSNRDARGMAGGGPPTHMMTLDRRVPGNSLNHHHRLLPSGCDLTLNRNSYSGRNGTRAIRGAAYARTPDELWLV